MYACMVLRVSVAKTQICACLAFKGLNSGSVVIFTNKRDIRNALSVISLALIFETSDISKLHKGVGPVLSSKVMVYLQCNCGTTIFLCV